MIDTLTGLRGYAALWVFSRHFFAGNAYDVGFGTRVDLGPLAYLAYRGAWGVDVFFALSGFVMMHVYESLFADRVRRRDAAVFLGLRLGRIYPLHVTVLLLMALGYATRLLPEDGHGFEVGPLVANLLLVHCWGVTDALVWNRPSWSISAEWFAYLWFPLMARGARLLRGPAALLGALAAGYVLYVAARFGVEGFARGNLGPGSLLRVGFGFGAGVILYRLTCWRWLERVPWDAVCLATIAGLAVAMTRPRTIDLLLHVPVVLLVFAVARSRSVAARLFDNRVSVYLGEISYSVYMIHFPLLRLLTYNFGASVRAATAGASQPVLWACTAGALSLVLAASALCYHAVEVPCRDWAKRRLARV